MKTAEEVFNELNFYKVPNNELSEKEISVEEMQKIVDRNQRLLKELGR